MHSYAIMPKFIKSESWSMLILFPTFPKWSNPSLCDQAWRKTRSPGVWYQCESELLTHCLTDCRTVDRCWPENLPSFSTSILHHFASFCHFKPSAIEQLFEAADWAVSEAGTCRQLLRSGPIRDAARPWGNPMVCLRRDSHWPRCEHYSKSVSSMTDPNQYHPR